MIEVGLIGFGLGGRCFHAPVIRAVPGLHLTAILQRSGDSAAQLYPDVKIVRDIDELLAIDAIRLIAISTPNQTHYPLAKRCLEAGRDVVVDKPFTTTVAEAVELLTLAKKLGRVLTVYHNRRFDADFQALRGIAATRELGRTSGLNRRTIATGRLPSPGPGAKSLGRAAVCCSTWRHT